MIIFSICFFTLIHTNFCLQIFSTDSDIIRNTSQLINSRGFTHEIHHPITSDGYILTLFRIVNPYRNNHIPVYFQHGLFGNSDNFLLSRNEILTEQGLLDLHTLKVTNCTGLDRNSVGRSLALVLASCGYDVWLGNFRGNRYSNKHILFDPKTDHQFWSYSIDQLSTYDITANIDYILYQTKHCHSLGTSVLLQLLSYKPEYSRHIKPAILLAPVAYVSHIRAPLLLLAAYNKPFIEMLSTVNKPIFGLSSSLIALFDQLIATFICGNTLFRPLCTIFVFSLCGFDFPNTDQSLIPFAFGHFPDDTSSHVLAHLAQRVVHNTFSFYDYGKKENFRKYSNSQAPNYNLSKINSEHLILISGINDWLADPADIHTLRSQLRVKLYRDYVMPYPLFNHADFLLGNNVGTFQNSLILNWLNEIYYL